jgi:hypothetical protein
VRWPLAAAPPLALAGLLALAPRAGAGGDPLQLAACGPRLWVAGQGTAAVLDARDGRLLHRIRPRLDYPVAVACSGDEGFLGSVVNGYGSGAVQRVSAAGASTPLPGDGPVYGLTARAGRAWVLTGAVDREVVELGEAGTWRPVAGSDGSATVAAGPTGLWLLSEHFALRFVPYGGRLRTVATGVRSWPASCGSGALATVGGRLVLFDGAGRRRWTRQGRGDFPACAGGSAYVLVSDRLGRSTLRRLDLADGRTVAARRVPGPATSLAAGPYGVWVAVSGPSPQLRLLSPTTLRLLRSIRL